MFPDLRFLRLMLILLVLFMPAYLWLACAFFRAGDYRMGLLCLAWVGLLILACRWGWIVLDDGKDDD